MDKATEGQVSLLLEFVRHRHWCMDQACPQCSGMVELASKLSPQFMASARSKYKLDEFKQPTCPHCGEKTNKAYRMTPNLVCWKCGKPMA